MNFTEKLYGLYPLIMYKRNFEFIFSMLFLNSINIFGIKFSTNDYELIQHFLIVKNISRTFEIKKNKIKISFDNENFFYLSKSLTPIDKSLLYLLSQGIKDGAIFVDENNNNFINQKNVIRIIQSSNIVEVYEGIKYDLENVGALTEIYIRRIHEDYSNNMMNKIVVDLGASVGDTPLYFASKGAKVFAVEMSKKNYDAMLKNISLNPTLKNKIIPVHLAFGKDENIEYYTDSLDRVVYRGGSTFLENKFGKYSQKHSVIGMSLQSFRNKYDLKSIDLLKIDCKGAEFFLKADEIENIKIIKIEYKKILKSHNISDLLKIFRNNFNVITYKHTSNDNSSFSNNGNILAIEKVKKSN